ncbi:uncharacterized protein ARMOST_22174 [Armillaria ostoyae]|uniref:Uncharacterized protein n=1 Tax=Armillaria ostoyae TaxID=47428 RepID=A0A284SC45_ARMOS|nr:uncharacterized protein ARMOST_22174 [Armillaria ostoyae]
MFNEHDKASASLLVFAEGVTAKLHEKESLDGHLVCLWLSFVHAMSERYYRHIPPDYIDLRHASKELRPAYPFQMFGELASAIPNVSMPSS